MINERGIVFEIVSLFSGNQNPVQVKNLHYVVHQNVLKIQK